MEVLPLKSELITPGTSIQRRIIDSLQRSKVEVRNGNIIAIASKVIATAEGRIIRLASIKPSRTATLIAGRHGMPAAMVQIVMDEADEVYGGVNGALLTLKSGDAVANSGVDQKNAPVDSVVLWPEDPTSSAKKLCDSLRRRFGKKIGVVIVDSRVTPLRLGTTGMALACAGFDPIRDLRGTPDLFGRKSRITVQASADGVAATAHLLMGEGKESIPFVLIRGAPVDLGGFGPIPRLPRKECLYMSNLAKGRV